MADGFIQWYREDVTTAVFAEQAEIFSEFGIKLIHPNRNAAVVLDIEGDDVLMSREELGVLIGRRFASLTFNWWLTADTNVIDTYEAVPVGRETQTLWLDGLCPDEVQRVESAVMAAATRLPVPTRAVIVDRRGISDPDAWDSVALWDGTGVPLLPDKVLAPDPIAERIRRSAPGLRKEDAGGGGLSLLVPRHDPAA
ncbi:hypothetical protein [Streptomyces sp. DvalAA-19]|uniref:hypothetical protein n=1 Tax=Streptomyces sp. DvalAA-19 TaxID=1839761 RepID=UPI00081B0983|nr:hypothetical protein [Streptomyces sp. DvalAA-19]SCD73788.1 hypothetical protein GA0115244_10982 [Streptomyces sp. DvalAA-19]